MSFERAKLQYLPPRKPWALLDSIPGDTVVRMRIGVDRVDGLNTFARSVRVINTRPRMSTCRGGALGGCTKRRQAARNALPSLPRRRPDRVHRACRRRRRAERRLFRVRGPDGRADRESSAPRPTCIGMNRRRALVAGIPTQIGNHTSVRPGSPSTSATAASRDREAHWPIMNRRARTGL